MSHLPAVQLHEWKPNQPISASVLNHDFGCLRGLIDYAADLAVTPDPNGAEALQRVANAEGRLAVLERYNASTARELGQREYAPLASFGALVQQVSALRDPLSLAAAQLRTETTRRHGVERTIEQRLALLEAKPPAPPAPSVAEFEQLRAELAEARDEARAATWQADRLRAELTAFCASVEAAARDNRTRFVPLPALAALLKRMDAFTASTAADDVKAMREEVAKLHRLIRDTDRKDVLHRQFTPRSMAAYMLKRLERVEAKLR